MPPVENTSSPADLDMLNTTMRALPKLRDPAERVEELNEVIHRANPALRETDEVLKILADQNRSLARLARDSDEVLGRSPASASRSPTSWCRRTRPERHRRAARRPRASIHLLPDFLRGCGR